MYNEHMGLMAPFQIYLPKHHMFYHLLWNIEFQGNPEVYSNWMDETLNNVLKSCCRHVHQMNFEAETLLRMRELLRREFAK